MATETTPLLVKQEMERQEAHKKVMEKLKSSDTKTATERLMKIRQQLGRQKG